MKMVIVYTQPDWFFCRKAKEFLSQRGVVFTEKDITADPSAVEELEKLSAMTTPVIVINGDVVIGFNRARLEKLLSWRLEADARTETVLQIASGVSMNGGKEKEKRGIWSRRDFFTRLGWGGFGVFGFFALVGFIRSAFPRVLFQPPTTFKGGRPEDYPTGEVSERFKQEFRVWIIREADGFYAIFAKCTHLGCTPRWLPAENKFKCPCQWQRLF
jgi:glutaredoxin